MESKRKHFSYKDILYKSRKVASLALIVVFGAGLMLTSAWESEIPVHDGDVLVDSLNISEADETGSEEGTFEDRRASLDLERNKMISALDSTISHSSNEAEKKNAASEKDRIMTAMETEIAIESLIETKNLPESFVMITENSVNVTVDKQDLDTNTVAKICDIVMRETGRSADRIIIQSMY